MLNNTVTHWDGSLGASRWQFPSPDIVDLLRRNEREMPEEAFQKPESVIFSFACGFQCIYFQATQGDKIFSESWKLIRLYPIKHRRVAEWSRLVLQPFDPGGRPCDVSIVDEPCLLLTIFWLSRDTQICAVQEDRHKKVSICHKISADSASIYEISTQRHTAWHISQHHHWPGCRDSETPHLEHLLASTCSIVLS